MMRDAYTTAADVVSVPWTFSGAKSLVVMDCQPLFLGLFDDISAAAPASGWMATSASRTNSAASASAPRSAVADASAARAASSSSRRR